MKLLQEIIDLAVEDQAPLSVLLRKCLVLSTTLKNEQLKDWVTKELNGYDEKDILPKYRVLDVHSRGHFRGPFGAAIENQPLPSGILREEHRDLATKAYLRQPIAAYELLLQKADIDGGLRADWSPDLTRHYQSKFISDYGLVAAWQDIPVSSLASVGDTIRNRILSFALEIKEALDIADDDLAAVPKEQVNQHVTTIIYGGTNVVSALARDISQVGAITVEAGDLGGLERSLESIGLEASKIGDLKRALGEDRSSVGAIGPNTTSWLSRTLASLGKAGLKVGTDVATAVITRALNGYLGIT